MPSRKAASISASMISSGTETQRSLARAASTIAGVSVSGRARAGDTPCKDNPKASRSPRPAGSSSPGSSGSAKASVTKFAGARRESPSRSVSTSPVSMTRASWAAARPGRRSAIGTISTPPSARASNPASATGRPAASVAARSSPPIRRSSVIETGIRCSKAPLPRRWVSRSCSRPASSGAAPSNTAPFRRSGISASKAAARSACPQRAASIRSKASRLACRSVGGAAAGFTTRTPPRPPARRGCPHRYHPADPCAAGGAAPAGRPISASPSRPPLRRTVPRGPLRRASG